MDISGGDIENNLKQTYFLDEEKLREKRSDTSSNDIEFEDIKKEENNEIEQELTNVTLQELDNELLEHDLESPQNGPPKKMTKLGNIHYFQTKQRNSLKHSIFNNSDTDDDEIFNQTMNNLDDLKKNRVYKKISKNDFLNSDDGSLCDSDDILTNRSLDKVKLKGMLSCVEWEPKEIFEVKQFVDENFATDMVTLTSNHLDIIASYLNSQKIIYLESSYITSKRLNMLMIPTIVISAIASVLSGSEASMSYTPLLISSITAFNAFLLAIINYLKLDAQSEAHKISSHQYDKLQGHIMFLSGKTLLFSEASFSYHTFQDKLKKKQLEAKTKVMKDLENIRAKKKATYKEEKERIKQEYSKLNVNNNEEMDERLHKLKKELNSTLEKATELANQKVETTTNIEKVNLSQEENTMQETLMKEIRDEISSVQDKIKDIKETNQFEVPRLIRYRFPISYGTNVFTIIKAIDEFKISLTNKLWIIKNNIRYAKACIIKCNELLIENKYTDDEKTILEELDNLIFYKTENNKKKKKIYDTLISLSSAYAEIDKMFCHEIEKAEQKRRYWITENLCFYCPGIKNVLDVLLCFCINRRETSRKRDFGLIHKIMWTKDEKISIHDLFEIDIIEKDGQLIEY
tara:strand:+ start:3821 stop:5713 length:1893 start_codon:yes stop_codon:yes gene_type:complete